jgi:hypothetical protein
MDVSHDASAELMSLSPREILARCQLFPKIPCQGCASGTPSRQSLILPAFSTISRYIVITVYCSDSDGGLDMNETKEMSALTLKEAHEGRVLEVELTGKLTADDYQQFVPVVERLIRQHGKIRMLVNMHDFHGWSSGALWQDIKFDLKHFSDIERVAMIGENKWQHGMAVFCKPFTAAEVRYFDRSAIDEAQAWLAST